MRSGVPAIPYIHITDMHSHLVRLHFSYLSHDAPSRPYTKKTPPKLMKNPFFSQKKSPSTSKGLKLSRKEKD